MPRPDKANGWLFRVSSSASVGGGHVARCCAVGLELLRYGSVTMMLDPDGLKWQSRLEEMGFDVCGGADLPRGPWFGSLVDGYHLDRDCFAAIRDIAPPLAFILDQGAAPVDADLIISPTMEVGKNNMEHGRRLSGFGHALLGPTFRDCPRLATNRDVGRIFVLCGMRDSKNATGLILAALQFLTQRGFRPAIDVAIGTTAPHLPALEQTLQGYDGCISIHKDAKDIAGLVSAADMAIGAGGVSLFERMACGVPSITLTVAENQVAGAQIASDLGATLYAGSVDNLAVVTLADHIWNLANDVVGRDRQARAGRDAVDGYGAERVANAMMALSLEFQHTRPMSDLGGQA